MTPKTRKATDIVTLADLAPRHPVVGGNQRRLFGATDQSTIAIKEHTMATKKQDLPAKKTVKGGRPGRA